MITAYYKCLTNPDLQIIIWQTFRLLCQFGNQVQVNYY
jgi:hypothetical protein